MRKKQMAIAGLNTERGGYTAGAAIDAYRANGSNSAFAAIHGMRRDSLLLELKLTLKIA